MDIEENIPLSKLTTFRTGGPARFLLSVNDEDDIVRAVSFAKKENLPLIPLGDGSNLCAPDSGVLAAFVRLSMKELTVAITGTEVTISADAGLSWDSLVD
ncbi:FAD-binding protein, partial [Candidatus Kaiserbacteria bacterium]|nr:FAD-binding protein [Candidatus Kaiserbacteria bacterium]